MDELLPLRERLSITNAFGYAHIRFVIFYQDISGRLIQTNCFRLFGTRFQNGARIAEFRRPFFQQAHDFLCDPLPPVVFVHEDALYFNRSVRKAFEAAATRRLIVLQRDDRPDNAGNAIIQIEKLHSLPVLGVQIRIQQADEMLKVLIVCITAVIVRHTCLQTIINRNCNIRIADCKQTILVENEKLCDNTFYYHSLSIPSFGLWPERRTMSRNDITDAPAFRAATRDDFDEIVALFAAAIKHMDTLGIPQWDEIYPSREVLFDDLARGELYVGLLGGAIACAFTLSPRCDPEYAYGDWQYPDLRFSVIHRLCVHPAFQNRRVAQRAMRFIESTFLCSGIQAVRLDAFSLNPYALRLYERLGYRKTGEVTFRKGVFYLYEKKLPPDGPAIEEMLTET